MPVFLYDRYSERNINNPIIAADNIPITVFVIERSRGRFSSSACPSLLTVTIFPFRSPSSSSLKPLYSCPLASLFEENMLRPVSLLNTITGR